MRIVLLGSSRPAVVALKTLRTAGVHVVGVGSHEGERQSAIGESVLDAADRAGIPTAEFNAGRREEIGHFVRSLVPDLGLAVGFRYLIDAETLTIPRHGFLNLHSSLLPAYRGRAPVNWAIIQGARELGATLHHIDAGVDTGDIVFQERFAFGEDEDVSDALLHLETAYERLMMRTVEALERDDLPRIPMPSGDGRLWPRRGPEDGLIDWTRPVDEVLRLVRAVTRPYPGAFTSIRGRRLYILRARLLERRAGTEPGLIAGPAAIQAGDGELQPLVMFIRSDEADQPVENLAPFVGDVCG